MHLRHMHALVVEGDGGTGHGELRVIVSEMRPITKDTHSTSTKLEAATLHHINKGLSPLSSHSSHLRGEVVHINAVVALRFRRQAEIGGCVVQARTYCVCICASCQLRPTRHRQHAAHLRQHRPSREDSERPRSSVPDYNFIFLRAKQNSAGYLL